uniref:Vesicular, overexpressed in cancer, prosurvival protein 1 n=2 Tax=Graphocephala atropunctata TaxID=36148 RepID=A0A1B6MG53_9HEMI
MLNQNCIPGATLLLLLFTASGVHGLRCESNGYYPPTYSYCSDDRYCCGVDNLDCCSTTNPMEVVLRILFLVFIFVLCPWMCYRCCCRRTTNRGTVFSPAATTQTTTAVTVNLPPQGVQQVPYPTVVPYPQQTPYPPQYAINPYYGAPPPAYGLQAQAGVQQASAPTAPPYAQT